jgi:hypothetical protein
VDIDGSRVGGAIRWPKQTPWPTCPEHNTSLVPVMQLLRADVPQLGYPDGKDVFQLLWCPDDHRVLLAPRPQVFWWRHDELADMPLADGGAAGRHVAPAPRQLHPEAVDELPSAFELDAKTVEKLDEWITTHLDEMLRRGEIHDPAEAAPDGARDSITYQYQFSTAPGTKVGGHVQWHQEPEVPRCPKGHAMEHLLTIAAWEFDGASWWHWMPDEERAAKVGSGMTTKRLASGAVIQRYVSNGQEPRVRAAQEPSWGVDSLADGSLYVFRCPVCNDHPIESVYQR